MAADLVSMLRETVERRPGRRFLGARSPPGWRWTRYRELQDLVDTVRGGLAAIGVARGDRVAIVSANRLEWVAGCYAALGLGATWVPLLPVLADGDLSLLLGDVRARVCIAGNAEIAARISRLVPQLRLVRLGAPGDDPGSWQALLAAGSRHPVAAVAADAGQVAEIHFTSGTGARPKGVRLTHAQLLANLSAITAMLPEREGRSLSLLPWAHLFGALEIHGVVFLGTETAVCEDPRELARDLREARPTSLFAVPRVWNGIHQEIERRIAESPRPVRAVWRRARHGEAGALAALARVATRLLLAPRIKNALGGRIRYGLSSGAALAPDVVEVFDRIGVAVLDAYGLTEAGGCVTANRIGARRFGSVGKPMQGVRVFLDPLVPGACEGGGEILVRSPSLMTGYVDSAGVDGAFTAEGALRTGDLGHFDQDGFLWLDGRARDVYKLDSGRWVDPGAIEARLTESPLITQAFVAGANRRWNVALLVTRADTSGPGSAAPSIGLDSEIARINAALPPPERVAAFAVLEEPFAIENGLLTPTLKIRRDRVLARYGTVLASLWEADSPGPRTSSHRSGSGLAGRGDGVD